MKTSWLGKLLKRVLTSWLSCSYYIVGYIMNYKRNPDEGIDLTVPRLIRNPTMPRLPNIKKVSVQVSDSAYISYKDMEVVEMTFKEFREYKGPSVLSIAQMEIQHNVPALVKNNFSSV